MRLYRVRRWNGVVYCRCRRASAPIGSINHNDIFMNIRIKATSFTLTPAISEYADKRLEKIARFLDTDPTAQCDVDLGRTTSHHHKGDIFRAEIHIVAKARDVYASAEKEDLYSAIDVAYAEVLHSLKMDKAKQQSRIRRGGAAIKNMAKGLWDRRPGKRS